MMHEYFRIAFHTLFARRTRSFLTIIGIFIGIAAIVGLISVGQGLQDAIAVQFESLGSDKIIIQPMGAVFGSGPGLQRLHEGDLDVVRNVRGVKVATPSVFKSAQVRFKDSIIFAMISGGRTELEEQRLYVDAGRGLEQGRLLETGDTHVALVGYLLAHSKDYFQRPISLGDTFYIAGEDFRVVGIFKKIGNPHDDTQVVIPYETAQNILDIPDTDVDIIFVQSEEGEDPQAVADRIERRLRSFKDEKEGETSFDVQTSQELLGTVQIILDIVAYVLIGIASISLLVGGIGIMNTMYTSVLERTREIGLLKAIGASRQAILLLFLAESALLGFVGGFLGIIFGLGFAYFVSFIVNSLLGSSLVIIALNYALIIGALVFSSLVGMLSGFFPALQASRLQPVEALRYE